MTFREFWLVYDAKVGGPRYAGGLKESEVARLYALID